MFCTRCGVELRTDDCFCSRCGHRTGACRPPATGRSLMLDKRNKKIAGVCAGFARYFEIDANLIRIIWLAAVFCGGVGIIPYIAAWLILPSDHGMELSPAVTQTPQTVT